MRMGYSSGVNLVIAIREGEIKCLAGDFYTHKDSFETTNIELTDKADKINVIKIRNQNEIDITANDMILTIEFFRSVVILENVLIVEV